MIVSVQDLSIAKKCTEVSYNWYVTKINDNWYVKTIDIEVKLPSRIIYSKIK